MSWNLDQMALFVVLSSCIAIQTKDNKKQTKKKFKRRFWKKNSLNFKVLLKEQRVGKKKQKKTGKNKYRFGFLTYKRLFS